MYKSKTAFRTKAPVFGLASLAQNFSTEHPISKLKSAPRTVVGFGSKQMHIFCSSDHSIDYIRTPIDRDPKRGLEKIYTHGFTHKKLV